MIPVDGRGGYSGGKPKSQVRPPARIGSAQLHADNLRAMHLVCRGDLPLQRVLGAVAAARGHAVVLHRVQQRLAQHPRGLDLQRIFDLSRELRDRADQR